MREQLSYLRKAHGIDDPRLVEVRVPHAGKWLLELFWKLSDRRDRDGMSGIPKPITYTEIAAYQSITRVRLSQFELLAVEGMDAAYLGAALKTKRGE